MGIWLESKKLFVMEEKEGRGKHSLLGGREDSGESAEHKKQIQIR